MGSNDKIWVNALLFSAAIGAGIVGISVYLLDRQPDSVYFLPEWISITKNFYPVFGSIGYQLPTFIHIYVFILLTFIVLSSSNRMLVPVCFTWFSMDSIFELAQVTGIAQWIAGHVPAWFYGIPFLENTAGYFLAGTFDFLDIVSIAMGTVAAYLTIRLCVGGGGKDHVTATQTIS